MKATVKKINFTIAEDWLFILEDGEQKQYFIMNNTFYKQHSLESPVNKMLLDWLDKGMTLRFEATTLNEKNIVTKIL